MVRFLCGDIGGTNCRLQLFESLNGEEILLKEQTLPSKAYPSLSTAILEFLKDDQEYLGDKTRWPQVASFALAGPVVNNTCQFTNVGWMINGEEMQQVLKIEKVALMNDFVGLAYGLLDLKKDDRIILNDVEPLPNSPIACLGAGTGLGEVFLTHDGRNYIAWPTEGGHSDLASTNPLDYEFIEWLRKKHKLTHVSAERLISGTGIGNIFEFLSDKFPEQLRPEVKEDFEKRGAAAVTERALQQSDDLCVQAVNIFARVYAAEAGNLALKILPFGGFYIAGGVAPKMLPVITDSSKFLDHFFDKGRMQKLLQKMPVYVVTHKDPGLLGSRVIARRLLNECPFTGNVIGAVAAGTSNPTTRVDVRSPSPSPSPSLVNGVKEDIPTFSLPPAAFSPHLQPVNQPPDSQSPYLFPQQHHQPTALQYSQTNGHAQPHENSQSQSYSSTVSEFEEYKSRKAKKSKRKNKIPTETLVLLSTTMLLTVVTAGLLSYVIVKKNS